MFKRPLLNKYKSFSHSLAVLFCQYKKKTYLCRAFGINKSLTYQRRL